MRGLGGLRVPARIAMLGYLCLAVAAGLALARVVAAILETARGGILRRGLAESLADVV